MGEKKENFAIKAIGNDMINLIEKIMEKFYGEYGFKPSIIDVTNLIAKRSIENNLF